MDAYSKLRPITEIERCECPAVTGLFLVYLLFRNPICCSSCRKELDPERLGLSAPEVDAIARCFSVYGSLYKLWIDSGEYEQYAKQQLIATHGQVNLQGMQIAREMTKKMPTHYWWFCDTDDGTPESCPSC